MTDNEILDCLKKTLRRLSPGRDRVSAVKFYCNYLKEEKGSFSVYVDKYVPKGYFGYSNKASLRSVASAMYRDIKNLIDRDFYNEVAPLLPPHHTATRKRKYSGFKGNKDNIGSYKHTACSPYK